MLTFARHTKNLLLAEKFFQFVKPAQAILSDAQRFSVSSSVQIGFKSSPTKKFVACAWTSVNNEIHTFRAHDRSHPDSFKIYQELNRLTNELIENGYKPDGSWIVRDIGENDTVQSILSEHCERLAIVYNLIQNPTPTTIQVATNLRMCIDCRERIGYLYSNIDWYCCRYGYKTDCKSSQMRDQGSQMKRLNDTNQFKKALSLYQKEIEKTNKSVSSLVINQALKACVELSDIKHGKDIHKNLSPYLSNNPFIQINLIRLYMKCGEYETSLDIFNNSRNRTTQMSNYVLDGLVNNHRYDIALKFFQAQNTMMNEYTFSMLFKACANNGDQQSLNFGKMIFNQMPKKFSKNEVVTTCALEMFAKSGDISKAEEIFHQVSKKNPIVVSAMMSGKQIDTVSVGQSLTGVDFAGFVSNKLEQKAIDLFFQIDQPDEIILTIFFNACAQSKTDHALSLGKKVFRQLDAKLKQSNRLLYSVLNMFVKCNDVSSAESLFNRIKRDVVSYGSMMKLYNVQKQPEKTCALYHRMKIDGLPPNEFIFTLAIDAFSRIGDITLAESLIDEIPKDLQSNPWIQIGLVDLWGKIGCPDKSKEVFDLIEHPSNVAYATMIKSFGLNGMGLEAIELFKKTPVNLLDNVTYICVLNACSHSGFVNQAEKIFEEIPMNQRTEHVYTAMIDAACRAFLFDRAQMLLNEYENKSNSPSLPMYMSLLSSARNAKNLSLVEEIYRRMKFNFGHDDNSLVSAKVLLANAHASAGDLSTSSDIRTEINLSEKKKTIGCSWTVVDKKIHVFHAHDKSHPDSSRIYEELNRLTNELIRHGYKPDGSWITREMDKNETVQSVLSGHSERLAIVYNLIQRPTPRRIQIVKNLRICGDCHNATKLIAKIHQCTIVVRDANRIHHFFPNGECSCKDHF
ncbi:unnamed protein product [Adineta ricciae]|uniref:DYW domain-containing protein n=1 Tax=Adineta ricciae TaxID=249248 RepID=A0A815VIG8_ADIRI|nr:unnamed protein product [Adineta ricciae]